MKFQQMNLAGAEPLGRTHNSEMDFGMPPIYDQEASSAYERITQLELDSYRVALVPREQQRGGDRNHFPVARAGEFLLLPLTWKELVTQVRWEAGQPISTKKMHILEYADVRIDLLSMEVSCAGRAVVLTSMEFKVLKFFCDESQPSDLARRVTQPGVGLRKLSVHPYGRQSRDEAATETGAG